MGDTNINEIDERPSKIQKLDVENDDVTKPQNHALKTFENFSLKRILRDSPENRLIAIEGSLKVNQGSDDSDPAVVVLEKTHFTEADVKGILTGETQLNCLFNNDIYYNLLCHPPANLNSIKATVIYPATQKHIEKYSPRPSHLVRETASLYNSVTLPHIETSKFDIQWVYNILEHKKEADRIVFEDPDPVNGFILLPDLKWDCRTISNLYLTAIVIRRGIKSIRDLTSEHLPLLENILKQGSAAIKEKYGLPESQLRIYFHYQPSYYHLHIHFTSLQFMPPGCSVERAHLLTSVIDNIHLNSSYYRNSTLNFIAFEGDQLLEKFRDEGVV
nr:EOG090X06NK [Macrothrix elegans]